MVSANEPLCWAAPPFGLIQPAISPNVQAWRRAPLHLLVGSVGGQSLSPTLNFPSSVYHNLKHLYFRQARYGMTSTRSLGGLSRRVCAKRVLAEVARNNSVLRGWYSYARIYPAC